MVVYSVSVLRLDTKDVVAQYGKVPENPNCPGMFAGLVGAFTDFASQLGDHSASSYTLGTNIVLMDVSQKHATDRFIYALVCDKPDKAVKTRLEKLMVSVDTYAGDKSNGYVQKLVDDLFNGGSNKETVKTFQTSFW